MYPDLIDRGFLHLKTYGAFMALGFLAAWQVVAWLCRRMGRDPEPCTNLIMWMMVSGVVGSRIAYVIEHWSQEFAGHPELLVRIDQEGGSVSRLATGSQMTGNMALGAIGSPFAARRTGEIIGSPPVILIW